MRNISYIQQIYNNFRQAGITESGALAMLGNWQLESGNEPNRLEHDYSSNRYLSKQYVINVTCGAITRERFASDGKGFGLAQWTLQSRKYQLYDFWKKYGGSLDNVKMQLEFAIWELKTKAEYSVLWKTLCSTKDLSSSTRDICYIYERPAIMNVKARIDAANEIKAKLDLGSFEKTETIINKEEEALEMTAVESAVQWAVNIANDNSHGYSQANRWGPDYDCASLVISAFDQAGIPVKKKGATYTGNMRTAFIDCGFVDVTYECGLTSGYGIKRGDVLLNYAAHTALAIGDGKVVHARSSEGNSISGDQSGNEIRIQNYWNYPWNCILRYKNKQSTSNNDASDPVNNITHEWVPAMLKTSNVYSADCVILQSILNRRGFECGKADGYFGPATQAAVNKAQDFYKLTVDGICGPKTWEKLLKIDS